MTNPPSSVELKVCPWCGKPPSIVCPDNSYGSAMITCGDANECPGDVAAWADLDDGETFDDAIRRWNTRANARPSTPVASPEMIERAWADFINCEDDRYFGTRTKREKQLAVLQKLAAKAAIEALAASDEVLREARRFSVLATADDLERADEVALCEAPSGHLALCKEAASWLRDQRKANAMLREALLTANAIIKGEGLHSVTVEAALTKVETNG